MLSAWFLVSVLCADLWTKNTLLNEAWCVHIIMFLQ